MGLTAQESVEVVKALAWPITILIALATLYRPICELARAIGQRAIKLSIFKVEIELAKLTQARESLETTIDGLRKAVVYESGIAPITAGVIQPGAADYVVVALAGDADQEWLTSRLFLLAAILERSRVVRCIVFTGERENFLGAATPRDVRAELGAKFPEYERALFRANGAVATLELDEFRGGDLSDSVINVIARNFLSLGDIVALMPQPQATRWVYLDHSGAGSSSWEFAEWVTARGLQSVLRDKLSLGSVVATPGVANEEVTQAIVRQPGTFVASMALKCSKGCATGARS